MTSSPLFIMVAESIVIFGPIFHVGMRERVLDRDRVERLEAALAEGAARRREDQAPRLFGPAAAHGLVDRAVLGVDRDELGAALSGLVEDELAGDDQRFLVGEGEALSGADRGVRRAQAQRADEAPHDGIGLRVAGGLGQAVGARDDAALRARGQQPFEPARRPRRGRWPRAPE